MTQICKLGPGMALCLILAIPCWLLGKAFPIVGGPVFAILSGMVVAIFYQTKEKTQAGIAYTSKKILQYAVILLGFGLNLSEIAKVGAASLPIIISTISTSLIVSFLLYKLMKMPANISTLIGVGSSICGGSAIAAAAPVIHADDDEIAQSISVIFLFNIIAALVFPTLGGMLGLSNEGFGLFAGTAVNDTSSVTATAAIIPITLILAILQASKARRTGNGQENNFSLKKVFPFFVLFFILASVITTAATSFGVPSSVFQPFKELSKFFIIMAMAAIGLNTDIVKLIRTGGKPILMGLCCWIAIAVVSLEMQDLLGIF